MERPHTPLAIIGVDASGRTAWVNATARAYFGAAAADLAGSPRRRTIDTLSREVFGEPARVARELARRYDTNAPLGPFECRVTAESDRQERWLEAWVERPGAAAAKPGAFACLECYYDATAERRHQMLRAAERHALELVSTGAPLHAALDAVLRLVERREPAMICSVLLVDRDGRRLLHGAGPSLPEAYSDLVHGIEVGPAVGSCGTAAYRRARVVVEDIATDPLWVAFRAAALAHGLRACWSQPIVATTGDLLGTFALYYREPRGPTAAEIDLVESFAAVVARVIERKRTVGRLERQHAELAHAQRVLAMGQLASGLAHELNQPLTAIANFAEACQAWVRDGRGSRDDTLRMLADVTRQARRAGTLICHLRDFVRRRTPTRELVEVDRLVTATVGLLDRRLATEGIRLRLRRGPRGLMVLGDAIELEQVLYNLGQNAAEAITGAGIAGGEVRITVATGAAADPASVTIAVADNGPGIPDDLGPRVFDPFVTTKPDGLGIGLALARSIVEAHGGALRLDSPGERGASFRCTLPRAPEARS